MMVEEEPEAPDTLTTWQGQISVKERLELAMRFALADSVFGVEESQFLRLRQDLIQSVVAHFGDVHGTVNAESYPGYRELIELTNRTVETSHGTDLNHIWSSPAFVMPAIAALAQMFERTVTPYGDSRMTLYVRQDNQSLYGYHLVDLRARGFGRDSAGRVVLRDLESADFSRISAFLVGAAYFFLRGGNGLKIGSKYLLGEAGRHHGTSADGEIQARSRFILPV